MQQKTLKNQLEDKSKFVVYVELTGGPGFDFGPVEEFLRTYKANRDSVIPEGFDFFGKSIIPE